MPENTQIHLIDFKNCLSFAFIQALPYIRNSTVGICFQDFSIHFAFGDQICKLFSIARIRVSLTIFCLLKTLEIIHTVCVLKFSFSEKATNFCKISTLDLSYVVMVKSTVDISQNFVAFIYIRTVRLTRN